MKKGFLVVLTLLINLYVVHAQEAIIGEKILGINISSLLVGLPIVMILIGVIFFVGLYIKDNYGNIRQLFKTRLKLKKTVPRREKPTHYPQEIKDLQKQLPTLEADEGIRRLSNIANKFFAEKLNLQYEFTHGELEKELEKEKKSWAAFPKKLSALKFSGEHLSKQEVNNLVKEFWDIVKYEKKKGISLTVVEKLRKRRLGFEIKLLSNLKRHLQKTKPKGEEKLTSKDVMVYFLKKQKQNLHSLTNIFRKIKEDSIIEIKSQLELVDKIKNYFSGKIIQGRINNLLNLTEKAQEQITKGKINQAKKTYKTAYHQYYKLPIEEQVHIITELQKIQKRINEYKKQSYQKPQKITKQTLISLIKKYLQTRYTKQNIIKTNNLIEEAQEQITKGKINQAKKTYKTAYHQYYKLPIEKQAHILSQLRRIKDQINYSEEKVEKSELEEFSKELSKLKSEQNIYVILEKSDVPKRLNSIINYIQRVQKQSIHGLKAGKIHLKEILKELVESAHKTEKKEKKLTHQEKRFLTKIKEVGKFYTKKEEALEKVFKQKQTQIFDQLHDLTKQIKIAFHPKTKKKIVKPLQKQELKPTTLPPLTKPTLKKESELLREVNELLVYLKKKHAEGLYKLGPSGKEFLSKIEVMINNVKKREQKGIKELSHHEKRFLHSLSLLLRKKDEKVVHPDDKEKRKLEFLEHMKEKKMVYVEEQKLKKEKERLQTKPEIEIPRIKISPKYLKKLEKEEQKIIEKFQKVPKFYPPIQKIQPKKLEQYEWEVKADQIKRQKTKAILSLTKEEEGILSKLRKL